MRAFIIVALAAAVHVDAKPYTVGQVLAGATNGGVIPPPPTMVGSRLPASLTLLLFLLLVTPPLLFTARGRQRLSPTPLDRFSLDTLLVVLSPLPPMLED